MAAFFKDASARDVPMYLTAVTIGELRRGVELIRHRGEIRQANMLEPWLDALLAEYGESILSFDADTAQVWGWLRVPHPENPLDKRAPSPTIRSRTVSLPGFANDVSCDRHSSRHNIRKIEVRRPKDGGDAVNSGAAVFESMCAREESFGLGADDTPASEHRRRLSDAETWRPNRWSARAIAFSSGRSPKPRYDPYGVFGVLYSTSFWNGFQTVS